MSESAYEALEKKYGNLHQAIKLPVNPLGAYTDSQYTAANALLRQRVSQAYADILQQLGYTDGHGHFIMGDVESDANRQRADLLRSEGLAREDTTHQMQGAGTLFSGYRGTAQARAEHPFVQGIADLDVAVPRQLAKLFEQASGLITDYSLNDQQLLADAAARQAGNIANDPVYTPPTAPTGLPDFTKVPSLTSFQYPGAPADPNVKAPVLGPAPSAAAGSPLRKSLPGGSEVALT